MCKTRKHSQKLKTTLIININIYRRIYIEKGQKYYEVEKKSAEILLYELMLNAETKRS